MFSDKRTQREIQIKIAYNQSTNYVFNFQKTYYTKNIE